MYADGNMLKIKHDVLYEVAKLAFAGELEEKRDNIAMELIPGPTPQFRCCIYKERERAHYRSFSSEEYKQNPYCGGTGKPTSGSASHQSIKKREPQVYHI